MPDLHPLDLMNMVPADGDIPREIVAGMRGCLCQGNSHESGAYGCPMGEPISVTVEAYRAMVNAAFEMSKTLAMIADDENRGGDATGRAVDALRRLGLRD